MSHRYIPDRASITSKTPSREDKPSTTLTIRLSQRTTLNSPITNTNTKVRKASTSSRTNPHISLTERTPKTILHSARCTPISRSRLIATSSLPLRLARLRLTLRDRATRRLTALRCWYAIAPHDRSNSRYTSPDRNP